MLKVIIGLFLACIARLPAIAQGTYSYQKTVEIQPGIYDYYLDCYTYQQVIEWGVLTTESKDEVEKVRFHLVNNTGETIRVNQVKISDYGIEICSPSKEYTTVSPDSTFILRVKFNAILGRAQSRKSLDFYPNPIQSSPSIYSNFTIIEDTNKIKNDFSLYFKNRPVLEPIALADLPGNKTQPFNYLGHKSNQTNKNGKRIGSWYFFHDNGNVKEHIIYQNGVKEGVHSFYDTEGVLYLERDSNLKKDYLIDESGLVYKMHQVDTVTCFYPSGIIASVDTRREMIYYNVSGELLGTKIHNYEASSLTRYNLPVKETFHPNGYPNRVEYANGNSVNYAANNYGCITEEHSGAYTRPFQTYNYKNCELAEIISKNKKVSYDDAIYYINYRGIFENDALLNGVASYYRGEAELLFKKEVKNYKETSAVWLNGVWYNITDSLNRKQGNWVSNNQYAIRWNYYNPQVRLKSVTYKDDEPVVGLVEYAENGAVKKRYFTNVDLKEPVSVQYSDEGHVVRELFQLYHFIPNNPSPKKSISYYNDARKCPQAMYYNDFHFEFKNCKLYKRTTQKYRPEKADEAFIGSSGGRRERGEYPYSVATGQFKNEHLYNGKIERYDKYHKYVGTSTVIDGKINGDRILVFKDIAFEMELTKPAVFADADDNAYITRSEAAKVEVLSLSGVGINSVEDFKYFTKLKHLSIKGYDIDLALRSNPAGFLEAIQTNAKRDRKQYDPYDFRQEMDEIEEVIFEDVVAPIQKDTAVVLVSDLDPTYPGGAIALTSFVDSNLVYPQSAINTGIEGTVYVEFTIDTAGVVRDVVIRKGLSPACDKEAVRVVSLMPNWRPGEVAGKPVNVSYTLPIRFVLPLKGN